MSLVLSQQPERMLRMRSSLKLGMRILAYAFGLYIGKLIAYVLVFAHYGGESSGTLVLSECDQQVPCFF